MQFNVPITLNRTTNDVFGDATPATTYPIKCALMSHSRRASSKFGSDVKYFRMTIMIPYKKIEPFVSFATTVGQNFTYKELKMRIVSFETIPSFGGNPKFYEVNLKEIIEET